MASTRPRPASIAGFGNTGSLSATEQKGKDCHDQDKQHKALVLGSFLVPEIDMIFGDGVQQLRLKAGILINQIEEAVAGGRIIFPCTHSFIQLGIVACWMASQSIRCEWWYNCI